MTIQERLRAIKQVDAAERLGVSRPFIAQIARGIRLPSVPMAARIADKLGCSDEELGASVREWAGTSSAAPDVREAD